MRARIGRFLRALRDRARPSATPGDGSGSRLSPDAHLAAMIALVVNEQKRLGAALDEMASANRRRTRAGDGSEPDGG